jgi:lactate permease
MYTKDNPLPNVTPDRLLAAGATLPHGAGALLAVAPVLVLLALVLWGRFSTLVNAGVTVLLTLALGGLAFGADLPTLSVGFVKGAWVGVWILYVIWPALLMHHLATRVGMRSLGRVVSGLMPTRTANVLLLAWILPSFIQGVSGFGVPIAVAAPLLVAMGMDKVRAVALPLIGYHWAVGFGSMGSSFYMAVLTARLDHAETTDLAREAAILLGVDAMLSGILVTLVCAGRKGLREAWPLLVVAGPVMALTQFLVAHVEPAIGALTSGAAGIGAAFVVQALWWRVRRTNGHHPEEHEAADVEKARLAAVPYALLALVALVVVVPAATRAWSKQHLLLGPSLPRTAGGAAGPNAGVEVYNPIAVASHPGTFLLVACAASILVWRLSGHWPARAWGETWRPALRQALKSSPPVILLASVAGILVDTGMTSTIARGAADLAGPAYALFVPSIGALGSFITGSTTSSNALFSSLQAEAAGLLGFPTAPLLAGQLAGGNIGNSLAPVVALLGIGAIGGGVEMSAVLRRTLLPGLVLLATTTALAWVLITT